MKLDYWGENNNEHIICVDTIPNWLKDNKHIEPEVEKVDRGQVLAYIGGVRNAIEMSEI